MTVQATKPIKITRFIAVLASGSEISDPTKDSGYSRHLATELARIGTGGGTARLSAHDLDDLHEWLIAMYHGERQGGSPAGVRAINLLMEKAQLYARLLREQDNNNNGSTTNKEATMAKVTRSKSATKTAGKSETKTTAAKNGGTTRRTAEDWDSIVEEIKAARQAGETMQSLKKKYSVSSDVPMREALARAGYNSKGEALEYEDISGLSGAKLKARLVKEREEGTAWYMLALMTGKSESDLREVVGDAAPAGTGGRKAATKESAEDKEEGAQTKATTTKTTTAKRGRKAATKANPSKTG
jgi:hypothetical protein